jgi:hypothetical protein
MTNIKRPQLKLLSLVMALSLNSAAACAQSESNALTIYSTATPGAVSPEQYLSGTPGFSVPGYALVKHERQIRLDQMNSELNFTDVAALIDPTTVSFESLSDPVSTRVVEQNFQFDLVNNEKLMQKYLDREITVEQVRGDKVETFVGTLLSTSGGLVIKALDGSVRIVPHNAGVKLPTLPGGLMTRPTLVWNIATKKPGGHSARVSYQTKGITWWADYNLAYNEGKNANSCVLDVSAWVSVLNQSGASYADAKLKLVAGEVHRAPVPQAVGTFMAKSARLAENMQADAFQQKEFFEYHLYTLGRTTTLPDNSTKQIELFPAAHQVQCEKKLVYYGLAPNYFGVLANPLLDRDYGIAMNKKVDIYLNFKNSSENNMGMPLPSGRVRVAKLDTADKTLEFIGEDVIDHTPKNENVSIKLGSAFDVVGERKQTDFKIDTKQRVISEDIEIKLRNHKSEAVIVVAKENLYRWSSWNIVSSSHKFEKDDSRTVNFPVSIPKDGETTIKYSVRYTW